MEPFGYSKSSGFFSRLVTSGLIATIFQLRFLGLPQRDPVGTHLTNKPRDRLALFRFRPDRQISQRYGAARSDFGGTHWPMRSVDSKQ